MCSKVNQFLRRLFSRFLIILLLIATILTSNIVKAIVVSESTAENNTVTSGTLTLVLQNGASADSLLSLADMRPGDSTGTETFKLQNSGSLNTDHLEITFQNTVSGGSPADLAKYFILNPDSTQSFIIGQPGQQEQLLPRLISGDESAAGNIFQISSESNQLSSLDANSDGQISLYELEFHQLEISPGSNFNGQLLSAGNWTDLIFSITLDPNTPTAYQDAAMTTTINFTLNQHATQ